MPVRKAKGGYRWGRSGKIYRGKGAKRRAQRQGVAIMISQGRIKPRRRRK
jgi:hypothetical protein